VKAPVFRADWGPELQALYAHDMQEMWDPSIAPHIWNQYHNQLETYLQLAGSAPKDILDVGCAQGTLALLLAERGHRVTAVDLRPDFLEYAQSRYSSGDIRFVQANVLTDEVPGDFDLVFANQLIEHLVYPAEFLARLTRKLRPGGTLVIATPNGEYARNTLPSFGELGDPAQWAHLQFSADGDGHFYAYLAKELIGLVREAGFEDVRARFFESPMISGHMKVRYIHGVAPVPLLRALDRCAIALPWLGKKLSHQLMVTGTQACGTIV
jgi:2-polyprenyl-3-methyl-5-hydroxy-6-metoxy-1,4-benzoquinol methylase